ncbi:hypothetical protein B0T16DRAFT_397050 [Cercophora newfieldiana]|uniref:Restriction endonuclease domain-containing protein n=1 Tax=Cercophora newfieldiana TaxID=92897 RepID=A0AA39YPQ1_9PEZI|nr:hypothetical protein B0T16DRAFT_397050 [Cercophora newfieldiana]
MIGALKGSRCSLDYDPTNSLLITRMPSPIHKFFTNLLANEIRDQLKGISERADKVGHFAGQIEYGGSSRVLLREGISDEGLGVTDHVVVRREPDGQFQHPDAAYPGVVFEVSCSQDGKDLKKLASDYILRSNGDIKAVVGIDINDEVSTVSLWRPYYVKEEGEELELLEVRQEISCQVSYLFRANVPY